MVFITATQQQLYNIAMIGCLISIMIFAMFPQSIKIAMMIKKKKSLALLGKASGEFEIVPADRKDNLWVLNGDGRETLGVFESKFENVGRLFGRPTMLAYETITPAINQEACVLIRHLKDKLGVSTWREYDEIKNIYLNVSAAIKKEMEETPQTDYKETAVYKSLGQSMQKTFDYFDALWSTGYFPDVYEPIRLQDMEKFLKYYHDPRAYVVRERNAVSIARAQVISPEKLNLSKWLIIGAVVIGAFLLFGGGGDTSQASSYAVSNPLSSFLGQ